ncbi:hypothetical protein C3488_16210 [Streptomyces sp. Ru72]|nr:hypothetical protein C3488_16210 [Streptomyces sp. Ru72]
MGRGLAVTTTRTATDRRSGRLLVGFPSDPSAPLRPAPGRSPLRHASVVRTVHVLVRTGGFLVAVRLDGDVRLRSDVRFLRMRAQFFDCCAAPRACEGAIEVPSARVAEVHDAGRLGPPSGTSPGAPVKVVWETGRSGAAT